MLSDKSRPVIQATLPVVGAHIKDIADHFYRHLFAIHPEQYEIVHENLMWAIGKVLGDAVTPDVAAAWDEVYWLMAYTLVHVERGLYSARAVRPQTVWRQWEVEKKIPETA